MTKEELQAKVNELELTLNSLELNTKVIKDDIKETNKKLEYINKPIINRFVVQEIRDAIEIAIRNYNFDDSDNYVYDFEIDYDSKINICSIEFERRDELAECLSELVEDVFNVIPD
tara:strand:+ start:6044 stop:6391 length:348 start_codon:yes stop_codon:yes gene_type:complete